MKMSICIGLFGMVGASMRYVISLWLNVSAYGFPYGTLLVNLTGCVLLGWLTSYIKKLDVSDYIKNGVGTGLLGSYTTFSTLSTETVQLFYDSWPLAFVYILFSALGGLIAAYMGYKLGERHYRNHKEVQHQ
ncbi:fluoride efflux transporter FluC [Tuberibacillus sp. Marseille-P3662]|uniref:fluoride efflux transporter FluC n=1 Tax=Tuberibacillus sp. Marseille-P3662 TaxID=1965358 RepID=UPI000A1C7ED8|nr:CrcB family protein [Tuberibacillus sp. Marseille-P3662]